MASLIIIAIVLDIIIAYAGRKRLIGFGWSLLLGLLFSPLVSFIAVLLSDRIDEEDELNWGCTPILIIFIIIGGVILLLAH